MDSYQLYTDLLKRISNDYPDHFRDKDKLLALFIDLSPKSKSEIKALRGFVVNNCNEAIECLKGKSTSFSTDELIRQINIVCGNPEIDQEAASALIQSYADIIGVKYDRKRVQQEFGSSNASTRNISVSTTNQHIAQQSSSAPGNTYSTVNTGNGSSAQAPPPSPPPKPNKSTILGCILVALIISSVLFYMKLDQNKSRPISHDSTSEVNNTQAVNDSEERLQLFLKDATSGIIKSWKYGDFDSNGIYEAFAGVDENNEGQYLWYISLQGAVKIETGSGGEISGIIETNGRMFIVWKNDFNNSNTSCTCYGVKNGQYYGPELYGTDIVQNKSNGNIYKASPIFTYEGDYIRYTLCKFNTETLEFYETEEYYTEKVD